MRTENESGERVTHVSTTEARAGSRTRVTRNILFISLALIIVLFAIAVGTGFFATDKTGADEVNGPSATQPNAN